MAEDMTSPEQRRFTPEVKPPQNLETIVSLSSEEIRKLTKKGNWVGDYAQIASLPPEEIPTIEIEGKIRVLRVEGTVMRVFRDKPKWIREEIEDRIWRQLDQAEIDYQDQRISLFPLAENLRPLVEKLEAKPPEPAISETDKAELQQFDLLEKAARELGLSGAEELSEEITRLKEVLLKLTTHFGEEKERFERGRSQLQKELKETRGELTGVEEEVRSLKVELDQRLAVEEETVDLRLKEELAKVQYKERQRILKVLREEEPHLVATLGLPYPLEAQGTEAPGILPYEKLPVQYQNLTIGERNYKTLALINVKVAPEADGETVAKAIEIALSQEPHTYIFLAMEKETGNPTAIWVHTDQKERKTLRSIRDRPDKEYFQERGLPPDEFKDLICNFGIYTFLLDQGFSSAPTLYDFGEVITRYGILEFTPMEKIPENERFTRFSYSAPDHGFYIVMEGLGYYDGFERRLPGEKIQKKIKQEFAEKGIFIPVGEFFINPETEETKIIDLTDSLPITEEAVIQVAEFVAKLYGLPKELLLKNKTKIIERFKESSEKQNQTAQEFRQALEKIIGEHESQ